jgi:hypothetical protein
VHHWCITPLENEAGLRAEKEQCHRPEPFWLSQKPARPAPLLPSSERRLLTVEGYRR